MESIFKIIFYLERYMLNVETPLGHFSGGFTVNWGIKHVHLAHVSLFVSSFCACFCFTEYIGEAEACRIKFLIERSLF